MTESIEFLRDYRARLDVATESLGMKLIEIGVPDRPLDDDQIVELAARKLGTLFKMLQAAGLSDGILRAVMEE